MINNNMYPLRIYYAVCLPYILPITTLVGLYSGIREIDYLVERRVPLDQNMFLKHAMGNYAFGMITGLTYPISLPLITGHYMYSTYKERCRMNG
jgi:hypothetical protein